MAARDPGTGRLSGVLRDRTRLATLALAGVAALVALLVADGVFPYRSLNHDEGVYLQQAELLLRGRLFLRPPVEDALRPWFFVESDRGLYPKYAPVPAAAFALGRLLGGYPVALAGVAAAVVGLTAGLGRELYDARVGLLSAAFVLCSPLFLVHAGVYLPYATTTALNLAFGLAYLRAERLGSLRLAAFAGVAVGVAFFARPYTAVLFAAPFVAHAAWTLVGAARRRRAEEPTDRWMGGAVDRRAGRFRATLSRRLATAGFGTLGVGVALAYNWAVTGAPLRFPYAAFAPEDGVGFGHREILGHDVTYDLSLALRSNARVLESLFAEWVVAGVLGTALAAVGLGALAWSARRAATSRQRRLVGRRAILAGLFVSVALGNLAFWGNYNILGDLAVGTDGLVHYLGPYYHFDLLVPTAVFAAVGVASLAAGCRRVLARTVDAETASRLGVAVLVVVAGVVGGVAAATAADPLERNREVGRELAAGYDPVLGPGADPPADAVLFLPPVYGPWLNHPFQRLRNAPDYAGDRVYAIGDAGELRVAAAFPDRALYRYVYAGSWTPVDDSTVDAELRRVHRVSGGRVALDAAFAVPDGARSVTVQVATGGDRATFVPNGTPASLSLRLSVGDGSVSVSGDAVDAENPITLSLATRDEVRVSVFVETGASSGFSYELAFPVASDGGTVRALSPTRERCPVPTRCVPAGLGDDAGAVETTLRSERGNRSARTAPAVSD